jgi:DNA (cytosine-5)-methyltransferase 1
LASSVTGRSGTLVDLFSGGGGFSLGGEMAGFHSLAAIDIDATLQSGFRRNFPKTRTIEASVADIEPCDWGQILGGVRPDGIVGGPPCQGFSRIGKRRQDDPRNTLIGQFVRHVNTLRPRFFIIENVEGLLDGEPKKVLSAALAEVASAYRVLTPIIVNAADYGAATIRQRVMVIGYDPSEMDSITESDFSPSKSVPVDVRQAISDLPEPIPDAKEAMNYGWAPYQLTEHLSEYARWMRALPAEGLGCQEAIQHLLAGRVSGMFSTRHSDDIARRYASIQGGKSDPTTKSYRLKWDGLCPTLRAGTGADKGAFQAVRPLHPGEGRVITVREAARLQGFPDWFLFHPAKWHSFRMIGNSVSPFVSAGVLSRVATRLSVALAA